MINTIKNIWHKLMGDKPLTNKDIKYSVKVIDLHQNGNELTIKLKIYENIQEELVQDDRRSQTVQEDRLILSKDERMLFLLSKDVLTKEETEELKALSGNDEVIVLGDINA